MATVLGGANIEYFYHCRKFCYWTVLIASDPLTGLTLPFLFLYFLHLGHNRSSVNICGMNKYRKFKH